MRLQKNILLLAYSLLSISYSWAQKLTESNPTSTKDSLNLNFLSPNQISLSDSVINYGKLFLNTPYHYGSTGTDSFDCSGFTSYVYRNFGYNLQRNSADQAQQFDTIDRNQLKAGDLVFFSGRRRSNQVGHVGIVVSAKENGEFDFIHSAVRSGVTISNSTEAYYTKRFIKANRVIGFDPMLAVNQPAKNDNITTPEEPTLIPFSGKVQKSKKIIPAEYHRVKSGETLSSISEKFGMTVADLKKKNDLEGSKINRNQKLLVREEETIMLVQSAKSIAKNEMTDLELANNSSTTHIVKKGESLFSISKSLNLSIEDLKNLNNLKSGALSVGQELIINQASAKNIQPNNNNNNIAETPSSTHTVLKGETLNTIAKVYSISIDDLKKINNLQSGDIKAGQDLKISLPLEPTTLAHQSAPEKELKQSTHKVQRGDNLSTISKKYNISIDDLKKFNNVDGKNIQVGQVLQLSESNETASNTINPKDKTTSTYKVQRGDNLSTISKKYNISIDDLKKLNNVDGKNMQVGQVLQLGASNETASNTINPKDKTTSTHKVQKGDNLSTISKKHNISIEDLKKLNNVDGKNIQVGQVLQLSESNETASNTINTKDKTTSTHKVQKGDNLSTISKKYSISIDDLKKFNNVDGKNIQVGQVLQLSVSNETASNTINTKDKTTSTHKVQKGDNLSTISKKYNISIDDLKKFNNVDGKNIQVGQVLQLSENNETASNTINPKDKTTSTHKVQSVDNLATISQKNNKVDGKNIQVGQVLQLSESNETASNTINPKDKTTKNINYTVKKGESLYTISKSQNISIDELKSLNGLNSNQLKLGQTLIISIEETTKKTSSKLKTDAKSITHKVGPGESFFTIAKTYSCTIDKIKEWNNKTNNKINIGDKLIIYTSNI